MKKPWFQAFALGCLSAVITAIPAFGAERVSFSYGPLELSIPVASLEAYAKEGTVDKELAVYTRYATPQDLAKLRKLLLERVEFSSVAVAQFFYSSAGETALQYLGDLIETDTRQNGFYALRSALILAAAEPEGLTLLNVLKKFPTRTVRVNSTRVLQVVEVFTQLLDQTNRVTALIEQQSATEAVADSPANLTQPLDLQQPASFAWQKETLTLDDRKRDLRFAAALRAASLTHHAGANAAALRYRTFTADLYLPQRQNPAPVLIISHGFGSDRADFAELAQHLASHGFAVVAIEHPGSNNQQLQSLLRGTAREAVEASEFINRPLDVSYLLDELERLNQSNASLRGRLNLQQVGVLGHSFGGYTALALAGAELNFGQLQQECKSERININAANLSMLLQCLAIDLPSKVNYRLQDSRVRAVFVMNPVTSSIFGQKGLRQIQIPVMLVAGSHDAVAPALLEQICPFTWFTTPDKYLVLIQGGTHVYTSQTSASNALPIPVELDSPDPELAYRYLKAMSLAFAKTYVAAQPEYRSYLKASYTRAISQPPLQLRLIQSLTATQLSQTLNLSCPGS